MRAAVQKKKLMIVLISLAVFAACLAFFVTKPRAAEPVDRTVMVYMVGSDLEGDYGLGTYNLTEAMKADYNEHLQFVVVTGGSLEWYMETEYIEGTDGIDPNLNQVFSVSGKKDGEEHGTMTLIEADGLPGFEDSDMADPAMLTAFIDYCCDNFSADKYSLILWDHGGGPAGGFGFDDRYWNSMSFSGIVEAIQSTKLIGGGDRLEIVDFDACVMATTDIATALSLYADYLVVSAETEPGYGQDYSSWLNALAHDPGMGGFEIGKNIVDGFVEFYTETEKDYATLAVIDTKNFVDRLLPALTKLDGILVSEAMTKNDANGKYNFYDEIYSLKYSIGYALNSYSLYDLGNLAGALGVPQTEFETLTTDEIRYLKNAYTDVSLTIAAALADCDGSGDDVIYSGFSDTTYKKIKHVNVRDLGGNIVAADGDNLVTVYPTGIALFCGDTYLRNTFDYINEMSLVTDMLPECPQKDYLSGRAEAPALYTLINNYGRIVSILASADELTEDISDVRSKIMMVCGTSRHNAVANYLVTRGLFESAEAVGEYLDGIAAQQVGEIVKIDNVTVKKRERDYDPIDKYKLTAANISAHNIESVGSSMDIYIDDEKIPEIAEIIKDTYGDIPEETLFPKGIHFTAGEIEGAPDMTGFIDYQIDTQYDLMRDFYASDSISWVVPEAERNCFVLIDSESRRHLCSITFDDASRRSGYITILIKTENSRWYELGFLLVSRENGVMKVKGLTLDCEDISERSFIPMNSPHFKDCLFAPAEFISDERYYVPTAFPISSFTKTNTDAEYWGITVAETSVDEVSDVKSVSDHFYIADIYSGTDHIDVTDLFKDANEKASQGILVKSLDTATVTVAPITYSGESQKPSVKVEYEGMTLTENVDYVVWYDGYAEPGPAMLITAGIGDFFGTPASLYTVSCATHSLTEISFSDSSCTEEGKRESICSICGDTVVETIPRKAHNMTHVPEVKPTEESDGNREHWICGVCEKYFLDEQGTRETTAAKVVKKYFKFIHDPADSPDAMKDIVKDEDAVYGFRPGETGSLKKYAAADWSDPELVEQGRLERIAYHQEIAGMFELLEQMQSEGKSVEEIAKAVSTRRNEIRIESYKDDPEGLATLKQRNLEQYGHEEGPLPEEQYLKYGSWEKVIEKAFSANKGMDVCLGLYDVYYDEYIALSRFTEGTVPPQTGDTGISIICLSLMLIAGAALLKETLCRGRKK